MRQHVRVDHMVEACLYQSVVPWVRADNGADQYIRFHAIMVTWRSLDAALLCLVVVSWMTCWSTFAWLSTASLIPPCTASASGEVLQLESCFTRMSMIVTGVTLHRPVPRVCSLLGLRIAWTRIKRGPVSQEVGT